MAPSRRNFLLSGSIAGLAGLSGCGYQVVGKTSSLPVAIKTISIPAFSNGSASQKLSQKLTAAIHREFLTRTRYAVTPEQGEGDALLLGRVLSFLPIPTVINQDTGRQAAIQAVVVLSIQVTERATGKQLYNRPSFEVRERYEVSSDPKAYFEESETAMNRLAQDVARSVVSAVLSGF